MKCIEESFLDKHYHILKLCHVSVLAPTYGDLGSGRVGHAAGTVRQSLSLPVPPFIRSARCGPWEAQQFHPAGGAKGSREPQAGGSPRCPPLLGQCPRSEAASGLTPWTTPRLRLAVLVLGSTKFGPRNLELKHSSSWLYIMIMTLFIMENVRIAWSSKKKSTGFGALTQKTTLSLCLILFFQLCEKAPYPGWASVSASEGQAESIL